MILPPPPRAGHELVVFVVDRALVAQFGVPVAVDQVVATARRSLAAPNLHVGWVLFDRVARAVRPWEVEVSGANLADFARRLGPTSDVAGPAMLDSGLAAAHQLARSFLDRRDDGLPVAVDLLAVVGPDADCTADAYAHIPKDPRIQAAVVAFDWTGAVPADLDVTRLTEQGAEFLGAAWSAARRRAAVRRRPCLVLG